jgi:precorrin-6B methylase 2
MQRRQFIAGLGALTAYGLVGAQETSAPLRGPDVIFVPTPNEVVDMMLRMAGTGKKDTVYDLGCGDGRIVITAAQKYGARGVGIDIDPERVKEATENTRKAGVADRVKIIRGDLFEADISPATVVTLYLLTDLNLKLRPKLMRDLQPGTRVVSHAFNMGDWKPERSADVAGSNVYLWRVPARKE